MSQEPVAAATPTPERPGLWRRFRTYAWDWRAVVAVAAAMFILGGLSGLVVGLAAGGDHHHHHGFRDRPGGSFPWGPGGPRN
ncbi:MAG: hypothetical protein ACTHOG_08630 [Marmoricola sp.]